MHGLRSKKLAKQVDAYRVDLIAQLIEERGGTAVLDTVSRIAIENYALVCAQHKTIEARLDQDGLFTQQGRRRSAFDMLKAISETIDRLRAQLPPPLAKPSSPDGTLADLSLDQLLERSVVITERLLQLRSTPAPPVESVGSSPIVVRDPTPPPLDEPTPPVETCCEFCHQTHAACVAMKTDHEDAWRLLHHADPQEIRRRRENDEDQFEARARGWPTARMIANAAARQVPETEEEQRAREIRRKLAWELASGHGTRREN